VPEQKICAACGRHVLSNDLYCSGCGVAFGGAPRIDRGTSLPGFGYHLVQGLGWGLGLILAGAIASVIASVILWVLIALAARGIR
jgi:hypothetical protein